MPAATPAPVLAFQMLPNKRGKIVKAPLACETCGLATPVLDENRQGAWLCPDCFVGAVGFGMAQHGW